MDTFIQLTINGFTLGSVYALIALGYSLVYGILKLLNFAHGDVFMVGSFIGFGALQLLGGSTDPKVPTWVLLVLITLAAMAGCALLGVVIERFAYRPLRNAPRIAPLISALGVSFFLAYSMQLMFGSEQRDYDAFALSGGALFFNGFDIGDVRVPLLRIVIVVSAFALMIVLWLLVTRTRMGKAMRATSYDREAAAMMGIDVDRVIVFAFVLGSALAGAAGVMFALRAPDRRGDRLPRRAEGVHRGRDRRDRLDPGRDGRRADPRLRGGVHPGLHLDPLVRPARVRDPDRRSCCSGRRASSASPTSRRSEWPTSTHSQYEEAVPGAAGTAGPRIGQDEWVARSSERRGGRGGRLGVLEARLRTVPWWAWLILFVAVVAALPIVLRERLRPPRRLRHRDLHAARARAQHRRRLGRPARSRLRRLLRGRGLHVRVPERRPLRPRPAGLRLDPARGRRSAASSGCSSGCPRGGSSATTSRS